MSTAPITTSEELLADESQSTPPSVWSHDCDGKGVKVEVWTEDGWLEIPTQEVELYVNRHGTAGIQRTAKVQFPMEWDGVSVLQYIQGFRDGEDSFSFAKVYFRRLGDFDEDEDNWELEHFGFVGGPVGEGGQTGLGKMWIYDIAELFDGFIADSETFDFDLPTPGFVLQTVQETMQSPLPIDIDTEYDYQPGTTPTDPPRLYEPPNITRIDVISSKTFKANTHTLTDVMDWLANETSAEWWTEPKGDGVRIIVSPGVRSTEYSQDSLDEEPGDLPTLNPEVKVIRNEALYDLLPINTVVVRGGTSRSLRTADGPNTEQTETFFGDEISEAYLGDVTEMDEVFPIAEVRASDIFERQGLRLSAPVIEDADAKTVDAAVQRAKRELLQRSSEPSEGEIILYGEPDIRPHDTLLAKPTCNGQVENVDVPTIAYKVEEVKHVKKSNDIYKTELRVSVAPRNIEVVEAKMERA